MTKLEEIKTNVERTYPNYSEIQKHNIVFQIFAKFVARGRTISRNLVTGKLTIYGPNIATLL